MLALGDLLFCYVCERVVSYTLFCFALFFFPRFPGCVLVDFHHLKKMERGNLRDRLGSRAHSCSITADSFDVHSVSIVCLIDRTQNSYLH